MKYKITMFSDFLWPFCYIGKGIVEKLKDDYDFEIFHKGFEIHPDVPEEGIPLEDYFPNAGEKMAQIRAMGQQYGVEINKLSMIPNSNKALQVAEYASEINKSEAFTTAMYQAVFVNDINISLVTEIKNIALSVGITEAEVDQVLATDYYSNILEDNKLFCRENNITSVPTFIINDQVAIVGAQSTDSFKRVFEQLKSGAVIL